MGVRVSQLRSRAEPSSHRFDENGETSKINEAIDLGRQALALRPPGHRTRVLALHSLVIQLRSRYMRLGDLLDLEEAIFFDREALELCPKGHPGRRKSLSNLAVDLSTRYGLLGEIQDLEEAIVLGREALEFHPKGHPDRSTSLSNLAVRISNRYNQLGGMQDLEEAIVLGREALELRPKGHPGLSASLSNLAVRISSRYDQLGDMQDLEETIVLGREALELRPKGHSDRPTTLTNLASHLSTRYKQLGGMQDLEEAIALDREALELRPKGHPDHFTFLSNLAVRISSRYDQLGDMQDLKEAIALSRESLELRPKGHPGRPESLSNLAVDLSNRYDQLGGMEDLEEAIFLGRESLELHPKGHPGRSTSLSHLATFLSSRYNHFGGMQDLREAIMLGREALELRPEGHPDRSRSLGNLARHLRTRSTRSRHTKFQDELFDLYTQLSHLSQVVSSVDVVTAKDWIEVAEEFQHATLLLAYETTLRLLVQHLATLPSLPKHHVVLKELTSSIAVDAFSACLRGNAPERAVELLEQGRSVFWSQLTRLHSPLHAVMECGSEGKALAREFTRLTLHIRNVLNSLGDTDQHEQLWKLNLKLQQVVTNIRALPGLSRFLLPSLFSDLRSAANGGPVIILNASKYSCDALIVSFDRNPIHVPLQINQKSVRDLSTELRSLTERAKREDMSRQLAIYLRTVWDRIVSPVIAVLQETLPHGSRIWWCPTAEFSLLPLHAAGPSRPGQRNLAGLYVSSYTPTLTSLIRARRAHSSSPTTHRKRFLAIGQATAPGESELRSVGTELHTIGQLVDGLITFTRIEGEEACIPRVVKELDRSDWVHFACHGIPDRKQPFESAFALHDDHFTIQRIIGCELQNPEFAYLSACHTTVGDEGSPDEVIHLAAAMQFVGFKSVIGTMWAVEDGGTNKVTSTFYKHMVDESGRLDYTRAAEALNKTLKTVKMPFDQRILYVHIGV